MGTTTITTSTGIELQPPLSNRNQPAPSSSLRSSSSSNANENSSDVDDAVLAASQLADSSVPDGGYGWVVVASCSVLAWWVIGLSYSWGVVQGHLASSAFSSSASSGGGSGGVASPATLSFVGSCSAAVMSSVAVFNARVARWMGIRWAAMLGVGLIGLSAVLSGFVVEGWDDVGEDGDGAKRKGSVAGLFVTEGLVRGLGGGLCFIIASSTPAQYFVKKRGLANGIVFAGGGFGGAVLSIALDPLITRFGPAWAFRVLGLSCLLTGLPAAWFVRERTKGPRGGAFVEWRLFRNPSFVLVFLAGAIGTFPLFVPPFYIPLYARAVGLSSATGAGLLAGFNFASAVGRIVSGMLCDVIGPLNSLLLALTLSALSLLVVWPVSTGLAPLALFVVVNGVANGGFFSTMPTVVGNVFGSARMGVAMGMVVTSWAGGYLMGAPIAGYLLAAYGGQDAGFEAYRPAMFYAGSMALGAAILVEGVRFKNSRNVFAKL